MSTRIYNGFRFDACDLHTVHEYMNQLRLEAAGIVTRMVSTFIAEEAIRNLDTWRVLGGKPEGIRGPVSAAWFSLMDRQRELKWIGQRAPDVDFSLEILIFPLVDKVLGIYLTEQPEFENLLKSKTWFLDYGYWTTSDPDEDVPEAEWKQRRADWDAAIPDKPHYPNIRQYGFSAVISNEDNHRYDRKLVMRSIPSFKARLNRAVRAVCWKKFSECYNEPITSANAVRAVTEFENWAKSRGGRKAWKLTEKQIEPKLAKKVTWRHLNGWKRKSAR